MGFLGKVLAAALPVMPRRLVQAASRPYIAGSTLEDALTSVRDLNAKGAAATVDILGEHTEDEQAAVRTREAYSALLTALDATQLDANVSIKLTALGLTVNPALCEENVTELCRLAASLNIFVRIDMESSDLTQSTLDLYERLRKEHDNVGPVIQAYLHRTMEDATQLAEHEASVRLCKGIYVEPPELALQGREEVRANFTSALRVLLAGGCYVGIATHDEVLVDDALALIKELELKPEDYEFQMLLGVREEMRRKLIAAGHRMRVYVPYGEQWYEYSMRRLNENPEIAAHVTRSTLARVMDFFGSRSDSPK